MLWLHYCEYSVRTLGFRASPPVALVKVPDRALQTDDPVGSLYIRKRGFAFPFLEALVLLLCCRAFVRIGVPKVCLLLRVTVCLLLYLGTQYSPSQRDPLFRDEEGSTMSSRGEGRSTMSARRTHTKSRNGCKECKRRKVKVCTHLIPTSVMQVPLQDATLYSLSHCHNLGFA
jgi:hypothetical protein